MNEIIKENMEMGIELNENIVIRKAIQEDIDDVVQIHLDAFEGFFLTSLGREFLKFYYQCFYRCKDSIILVACKGNDIIGFSATTMKCKGFNSRLIKSNFFAFGILSFKMLFVNPSSLLRLVKNLTKRSNEVQDEEDYAELYSIGVSKIAQGMGVGKKLLTVTENSLMTYGVKMISLTTDYYNNDSAVSFYRSMGYNTLYEFTTYPNRKMYRFIKRCNQ